MRTPTLSELISPKTKHYVASRLLNTCERRFIS